MQPPACPGPGAGRVCTGNRGVSCARPAAARYSTHAPLRRLGARGDGAHRLGLQAPVGPPDDSQPGHCLRGACQRWVSGDARGARQAGWVAPVGDAVSASSAEDEQLLREEGCTVEGHAILRRLRPGRRHRTARRCVLRANAWTARELRRMRAYGGRSRFSETRDVTHPHSHRGLHQCELQRVAC
jgi:hypothetical protein